MTDFINKRLLDRYVELPILVIIMSCTLLCFTIPFVNKTAWYTDSDPTGSPVMTWSYDKEKGMMSTPVDLKKGDVFRVRFTASTSGNSAVLVALYGGEAYDQAGMQVQFPLSDRKTTYTGILPFYRTSHPDNCDLRVFISSDVPVDMSEIEVKRMCVVRGSNPTVRLEWFVTIVLLFLSVVLLIYVIKEKKKHYGTYRFPASGLKSIFSKYNLISCAVILATVTGILVFLYRNINITYPITYNPLDEMGVFYYGKLIDEFGLSLTGTRTGGFLGADMFDYPYSDMMSFIIVKIISLFSSNPYLTINLFYFLCFYLIAFSAFTVFRLLQFRHGISILLSVLYAFSPYIQRRYNHMWLVPYFMIPIVCYISIYVVRDALNTEESTITYEKYYRMIFLSFLCAFNGINYAFFNCAIYMIAFVILLLNKRKVSVKRLIYPLGLIMAVGLGVVVNIIPNLIYYMINGTNSFGDLYSGRAAVQSEVYALRFIQLILPQSEHRTRLFHDIAANYNANWPMVNENYSASLGTIAAVGFIISLLLLFKKGRKNKELSYLNIGTFCIATLGGISSFIAIFITDSIRGYNRLSIAIMFFSLAEIALLIQYASEKIDKRLYYVLLASLLVFGIYDQTFTYGDMDYSGYESDRDAIREIEAVMPEGSMIFQLPYNDWPSGGIYKNFIGYVESNDLRWSYGAMQGREEAMWQMGVSSADTKEMIYELKDAGYNGLDFNKYMYMILNNGNPDTSPQYISALEKELGSPDVISRDQFIYFWRF